MSNCPNCGKKYNFDLKKEIILALMVDLGGAKTNHKFGYCNCLEEQRKNISFWKANEITKQKAIKMGDLAYKTWECHHLPEMYDCVRFNYGYHITNNRVICDEGNIDITEDVLKMFEDATKKRRI